MYRFAKVAFVAACIAGSSSFGRAADYEGWYVGLNIGGAWSRGDSTQGLNQPGCAGGGGGGTGCILQQRAVDGVTTDLSRGNVTGGFQAGYAWRYNFFVVGVEADINYFDFDRTETVSSNIVIPGGATKVLTTTTSLNSHYVATVRPRIGLVSTQNILFYITGGLAISDQEFTNETTILNLGPGGIPPAGAFQARYSGSSSKTLGTVWGGGIEYAYMPGRTFRVEYQRISFDNPAAFGPNQLSFGLGSLEGSSVVMNVKPTADIVRFGMNWRL
jgi:outer membrane immunogenic protein